MEIFRNDDQGYLAWIKSHPEGYVLNSRNTPSLDDLFLHKATCHHIKSPDTNYGENAFTGGNYIKLCAEEINEIKAWIISLGGTRFSSICSTCNPPVELVFGQAFTLAGSVTPEIPTTESSARGNSGNKREGREINKHARPSARPEAKLVHALVYNRNQDIVRERLRLADGTCDRCKQPAPFRRRSDNTPFLEVHHTIQLSHGGLDTLENTEALCPNCHRKAHYGPSDE